MIRGIIKLIFYILLGYVIYVIYRFFQSIAKSSKDQRVSKRPSGIMVKDETCNTYLPKEDALKQIYKGKEYFFCSKECRDKFLEQKKDES